MENQNSFFHKFYRQGKGKEAAKKRRLRIVFPALYFHCPLNLHQMNQFSLKIAPHPGDLKTCIHQRISAEDAVFSLDTILLIRVQPS